MSFGQPGQLAQRLIDGGVSVERFKQAQAVVPEAQALRACVDRGHPPVRLQHHLAQFGRHFAFDESRGHHMPLGIDHILRLRRIQVAVDGRQVDVDDAW